MLMCRVEQESHSKFKVKETEIKGRDIKFYPFLIYSNLQAQVKIEEILFVYF
jgi:hypothetical protein